MPYFPPAPADLYVAICCVTLHYICHRGKNQKRTSLAASGTLAGQLPPHDRRTLGECLELGEGEIARDVFHAAIGGRDQPFRRQVLERRTDAGGDGLGRLRLGVAHADDAKDHSLVAEPV